MNSGYEQASYSRFESQPAIPMTNLILPIEVDLPPTYRKYSIDRWA